MPQGQCSRVVLEPQARDSSSEWWFTAAAEKFMKLGVSTVDDETMEKLTELVNDPSKVPENLSDILIGNAFLVSITIVILLIAVGLLIATLIVCLCRWCSPAKEGIQPTKCSMVCIFISYGICAMCVLAGVTLFFMSLTSLVDGVRDIPKQLNATGQDIRLAVDNFGSATSCFFDANANDTIQKVDIQLEKVLKLTKDIEDTILKKDVLNGIKQTVTEYSQATKNLLALTNKWVIRGSPLDATIDELKEADHKLQALSSKMTRVSSEFDKMKGLLSRSRKESEKTKDRMRDKLENMGTTIKKGTKTITEKVGKIIGDITVAVQKVPIEQYAFWLGLLILLPLTLVIVLIFAMVILIIRFLCSCGASAIDPRHPKRGWISVVAGNILACGGYASMLIGAFCFILAALFFVIGFALMFVCVNSFEDEEMRIFQFLPPFEYSHQIQPGRQIKFSLHETFVKCRNEYSFVESIDATQLMAYSVLEKHVKELRKNEFAKTIRRFAIDEAIRTHVEEADAKIVTLYNKLITVITAALPSFDLSKGLDKLRIATTNLKKSVGEAKKLLDLVESRAKRDVWAAEIEDTQEGLEYALVESVAIFLDQMIDQSPQCGSIMKIWADIGYAICQRLMVPAQGMWLALLICGFSSFIVINTLFKGTLYLKNFATSREDGENQERLEGAGGITEVESRVAKGVIEGAKSKKSERSNRKQ